MKRVLVFGLLLTVFASLPASADPSRLINYQGRLVDSNGVPLADGSYDMTFKIYDALSGGTLLWTDAHTGGSAVTVTNGLFSVVLGPVPSTKPDTTPFFDAGSYYVEITVGTDTYSPRKQLTGASWSLNSDMLEGQHGSYYQRRVSSTCGVGSSIRIINADGTVTCQTDVGSAGHGSLTGLGNDDHTQYVHISTARTITAQHSFAPTVAQAPFTLGGNAQGQLVTGLNADQLDGYHYTSFILDGCTDCLNATEIEDIYVFNTSDTMSGTLGVTGAITGSSTVQGTQFISTIAAGTAPLTVTSTTKVTNLNVDQLDDYHAGNASGNIPVNNGTVNTNLNADLLDGKHYTDLQDVFVDITGDTMTGGLTMSGANGEITFDNAGGNLTLAGGTITDSAGDIKLSDSATITGVLTSTVANGTAPMAITSSTKVTNLNSDKLDGIEGQYLWKTIYEADVTLTTTETQVDLSSYPNTIYKIYFHGKYAGSSCGDNWIQMKFNGSTPTRGNVTYFYDGSTWAYAWNAGQIVRNGWSDCGMYTSFDMTLNATNSSLWKMGSFLGNSYTGGHDMSFWGSQCWNSTASLTSIGFYMAGAGTNVSGHLVVVAKLTSSMTQ